MIWNYPLFIGELSPKNQYLFIIPIFFRSGTMKCTICGKENSRLTYVGKDNVCSKCMTKYTIFKEARFSDDKRISKVLRRRKMESFEDLKKIDEKEYERINEEKDDPSIRKYKEKRKLEMEEIPRE